MREETDADANLALRVVLVMLVMERVAKEAVLDPELFAIGRTFRILGIDPCHAAREFDPCDFESFLINQVNAGPVLFEVFAVDHRLVAVSAGERTVPADLLAGPECRSPADSLRIWKRRMGLIWVNDSITATLTERESDHVIQCSDELLSMLHARTHADHFVNCDAISRQFQLATFAATRQF